DIPTSEEIKAIIAAAGKSRPLLLTAIFAGLRSSELRGLRWSDVDFKKGELNVRQRADRYGVIGNPKSKAGHRAVPLPSQVVQALREWKLQCPKGTGLVFPAVSGDGVALHKHCAGVHRGGECCWHHYQRWWAEVHRLACPAALLCVVVHQSRESRWFRLAAESRAAAARAFLDHDDDGRL